MRDFSYDTNQYISIDGNTENGYYTASLNYKRAVGLDIVSGREEYGARTAIQQQIFNKRLQLSFTLNGRKVKEDWGDNSMFDTALGMNPTMPIYNEDGSFINLHLLQMLLTRWPICCRKPVRATVLICWVR